MIDENVTTRARRLSFTIAELDMIQAALSGLTIQAGKDLRERIQKTISEECDPAFRAVVDAYREAIEPDDGELEIDHDAEVSLGDDPGAYVMVWKWVPEEDAGLGPTEIICGRCADKTNDRDSPNGELCPDCYDIVRNTPDEDEGEE